jgi:sulfite reductase beta subunit-like hemoprotein
MVVEEIGWVGGRKDEKNVYLGGGRGRQRVTEVRE